MSPSIFYWHQNDLKKHKLLTLGSCTFIVKRQVKILNLAEPWELIRFVWPVYAHVLQSKCCVLCKKQLEIVQFTTASGMDRQGSRQKSGIRTKSLDQQGESKISASHASSKSILSSKRTCNAALLTHTNFSLSCMSKY